MKFSYLILFLVISAPTAFSAPIGIIVPAYIHPSLTGEWQKLIDAAKEVPLTVIFNPQSGPKPDGGDASPLPGMYKPILENLRAWNGKVLGYIFTDYGSRPVADVKSDVDYYLGKNPLGESRYGVIDGFFLDQLPQGNLIDAKLSYYREIYDYIKTISKSYRVVGNPGTGEAAQEAHFTPASLTVDELVTFESNAGYAADINAGLPWKRQHSPGHFSNLAWDVASVETMRSYIDLAKSRNVGHIYVTDDNGVIPDSIYLNPWDTLPKYWLDEVQKIKELNAQEINPKIAVSKSPAGLATLTVNGSPGVFELQTSSDLVNWETITVVDSITGNFPFSDSKSLNAPRRFYRLAP